MDRDEGNFTNLWTVCTAVASHVSDDLREVFCILDNVDVPEHVEVRNLGGDARNAGRGDERVVGVQVRNDLEAPVQRNDLPLEVLLQDAITLVSTKSSNRHVDPSTYAINRMPTSW